MPSYDQPQNNCTGLSARLGNDYEKVNGLGGSIIGIIIGILSAILTTQAAGAYWAWRMPLVVLAIIPLIMFLLQPIS